MRQQERLYKVDNMVKISLLEEILMNAITGKELTEDEFHKEVVKGREKEYKDKKWALPPSLFNLEIGEPI